MTASDTPRAPTERADGSIAHGIMGQLIAEHDWSRHVLGPPNSWPSALKIALGLCLRTETIAAVYWGQDLLLFYNDATIPLIGDRHPMALGMPARETWQDSWPTLGPVYAEVMRSGREVSGTDRRFSVDSSGRKAEAYFSYAYTPIVDESGAVAGIFGEGRETTAMVLADRWRKADQERLRQMFEQAPGFFALLQGPEHVIEFLNPAAANLIGPRPVVGKPAREALPELEGQSFIELSDAAYASGQTVSGSAMPVLLRRREGEPPELRYLDLVFQPLADAAGGTRGVVVQGMDVTERLDTAKAIEESEKRFRLIAESAPVMIWMGSETGKCLYLNKALREFWGVVPEDVAGFDWNPTIHPDDIAGLAGPWSEGMRARAGFAVEARYRRSDSQYRTLHTTAQPRFAADGSFLGMIGVNVDVTETRSIEQALRQETRLLEVLNQTGRLVAAELDLEKIVQSVTDAGVEITGAEFGAFFYNVIDTVGESYMLYALAGVLREAFSNFPMPRATAVFRPTFVGEGIVRSDDILKDPRYGLSGPHHGMPPGHLPVRSYLAVPVISRTGDVLGGLFFGHAQPGMFKPEHERLLSGIAAQGAIAVDNARLFQAAERENEQRAHAEERLRELNESLETRVVEEINERRQAQAALQQAQKMEAIGQLTGGVAHDFNNLLQVIAGNLQLLSKDVAGNERGERRVANGLAGVSRGAKLASQLLAFGRRQALEPRTVNIGRLISGMDEMLRRTLGEAIEVETVVSGGLWNSFVDPSQTENALLNLAINARDAMESGGKLTIEVGNAAIDDVYSRNHPDAMPGQYVMLAVTDTGTGIAPEILDRVLEPFFSTKGEGKGSGLGLSMVYGFVKQSGGHVRIYSEVGHGTTVKLYLPRALAEEDVVRTAEVGPIVGGSESILVAEDDEGVRETVVEMLTDLGYRVLKAKDATAALSVLDSGVPIDLLFTDVVMPGPLKSPELARKVRERFPAMAVLFTSGYTENSIVHGGKLDPGVELLAKPYTRDALARKVRQVLAARAGATQVAPPPRPLPLPASPPAVEPAHHEAPKTAAALTVLLVEDEWLILMSSAEIVRDQGHVVIEALSAEDAMAALKSAPIDVLITDINLPGASGAELARKAREMRPGIGVVFASGHAAPPSDAAMEGAVFLSKPYQPADLANAIAAAAVFQANSTAL